MGSEFPKNFPEKNFQKKIGKKTGYGRLVAWSGK
jgi:hypothetical protein